MWCEVSFFSRTRKGEEGAGEREKEAEEEEDGKQSAVRPTLAGVRTPHMSGSRRPILWDFLRQAHRAGAIPARTHLHRGHPERSLPVAITKQSE